MKYRFFEVSVAGRAQAAVMERGVDPRNSATAAAHEYKWKIAQATQRRHERMRKYVARMLAQG